jgi:hypothetical protein
LDRVTGGIKNIFTGSSVDPQQAGLDALKALPAGTPERVQAAVYQAAFDKATPSALAKYGPTVGLGLGTMALTGGFDAQEVESPGLYDSMRANINPEDYAVNLGPVERVYSVPTDDPDYEPYKDFYASMAQNPYMPQQPRMLGGGGPANPEDYPRRTGPINGPGTATSDSIPAMLSDGEFVFTAKAVRGAGNGSRRDGAKRMYQMMKQFEGNS